MRLGAVGLGMAFGKILPAIVRHPGIDFVAAASPVVEERNGIAQDFGVCVFETAEQLCEAPFVDAVYISTPTPLHPGHIRYALEQGKHVLVEKPLALDLETALSLVEVAEQRKRVLLVGHSHSFDSPIQAMRRVVKSGLIGRVQMMHTWCYTDWIYRPRTPDELDTSLGGGVVFRQGAHQFDILRLIGGGQVRSVRAVSGKWDSNRPTEGAYSAFLEFADGTAATAVYNGYDHFHSSELTYGFGEWGHPDLSTMPARYGQSRKRIQSVEQGMELQLKHDRSGYRSGKISLEGDEELVPWFGSTVVSGERGDIRQTPEGLAVYTEEGIESISIQRSPTPHDMVMAEFYDAVSGVRPPIHDGRWACATLEVCLGVLESSRLHQEVNMRHQVRVSVEETSS